MTEPVAYLYKSNKSKKEVYLEFGVSDNENFDSIPLYTSEQLHPRVKMTQAEFDLFSEYNRGLRAFEQLEELIEVDSNMKWFVRRILPNTGGNMLYCTESGELTYNYNKEYATQFDTKEQAELWTNPLTEAVQLTVEE